MSSRKKICYSHASFCEKCSDGGNFLVGHCADSRQKENLAVIQSAVADLFRCEEIILIKEFLQQVADIVPALEVVAEGTACMDFPLVCSLPRMKRAACCCGSNRLQCHSEPTDIQGRTLPSPFSSPDRSRLSACFLHLPCRLRCNQAY